MLARHTVAPSDEDLTDRARSGDHSAYGELYRRHQRAAQSTARCLLRSRADADDVVAEAFAGVLAAIRNGRGPRDNFRRYLLACVRNGCRIRQRTVPVAPQDARFDRPDGQRTLLEDPERFAEADVVARAFAALAPRWQEMLWATAVEQKSAQEAGEQMALSPNAAAALAHRAREAFATAYLAEHVGQAAAPGCEGFAPHLAAYVRDQLPPARAARVDEHVRGCPDCSRAVADLRDVNSALRSLLPAPAAALVGAGALTEVAITSGTLGGASAGLPFGGLLLKGLAGVLLLAPVLVSDVSPFEGDAADVREPIVEVDHAASASLDGPGAGVGSSADDATVPTISVVAITVPPDGEDEPVGAPGGAAAPVPPSVTSPVAPGATAVPADTVPVVELPLQDPRDALGVAPLVDPLLAALGSTVEGVVGLVGTAADVVVTRVVEPVVERAVVPLVGVIADLLAGVVDGVGVPLDTVAVGGGTTPSTVAPPADSATTTPMPVAPPVVSIPPVTTPAVVAPIVTVPAVTLPVVSVPVVTVPAITVASVTTPAVVVPIVTVTVPALSLPAVTLVPGVTVSVPPLLGPG